MDTDFQVRLAAFQWLSEQVNLNGDVLSRKILQEGFEFQGQRIPLVAHKVFLNHEFLIYHYL